jgi:hypothetical protein
MAASRLLAMVLGAGAFVPLGVVPAPRNQPRALVAPAWPRTGMLMPHVA